MAMATEAQLAAAIRELASETYEGKPADRDYTWFIDKVGLLETLAGLTAEQGSARIVPGGSTIAGHAEHLRWSLALANAFARGESPEAHWSESWSVREVDEEAWTRLQADLRREWETLRDSMPDGMDWSNREVLLGALGGIVAHGAYHFGAIRQRVVAL